MKKHAGAYLEGCIASERSNWVGELLHYPLRVGRIQVGVCVVPACDRCGADIVNVEVRAENLQGLLPAPGAMAVLEEQSTREPQVRAAGASSTAQCGPHPCLVEEADFIAAPRPGLTPGRLDTRQGSWRGPPGLSAKEIPVEKVQGTAAERRSQFQPLSDSLRPYEG